MYMYVYIYICIYMYIYIYITEDVNLSRGVTAVQYIALQQCTVVYFIVYSFE